MDRFGARRNGLAAFDEARSAFPPVSDRKGPVFCPKPRKLGQIIATDDPIRSPSRLFVSHQGDLRDSASDLDVLNLILAMDGRSCMDQWRTGALMASSPPYFHGSPPSRAANPLVHDTCFQEMRTNSLSALLPSPSSTSPASPSGNSRKGGCARTTTKFGQKPATVRIEGFDPDSRRGHGIPAVA